MDFREHKLETFFVIVALVFLGAIFFIIKGMGRSTTKAQVPIKYEMPRPKNQVASDFSLEGREIEYDYNNPFKKDEKLKKAKAIDGKKGIVKDSGKKKKENSKKLVDKKKKSEEEKKTAENEAAPVNSENKPEELNWTGPTSNQNNRNNANNANGPRPQEKPQEDDERTAQQWRSLLNAQPTQENMDKLVQAYSRKEVSAAEFYLIIEDLLKNQKSETQKVGLYGVRSIQSPKAFTLMSEYYDNLNADTKPLARQMMLSYGQSARLDILAQVMRSGNQKATLNALNVVQSSLRATTPDPREVRAGGGTRNSRRYSVVLPALQQLQQSGQADVAQLAGQVYGQLIQIGVTMPGGSQQASAIYQGPGLFY